MEKKIQIRCVLKKGGDYTPEYVYRLKKAIEANTTKAFEFVCLTDYNELEDIKIIPLKEDWPGWWSKIELFRIDLDKVLSVYFDLDTVIIGNIDAFLDLVGKYQFLALRGFNQKFAPKNGVNFASGIMMGNFYVYSDVYYTFKEDPEKYMNTKEHGWMHGDQGFIANVIGADSVERIQSFLPENYIIGKRFLKIYKHIPEGVRIIEWSGKPRLKDIHVGSKFQTINHYWRMYD